MNYMKQRLNHSLSARLILTQALARSLEILQMPQLELASLIEEEIEKNPLLELGSDSYRSYSPQTPRTDPPAPLTLRDHLLNQVRENFSLPFERRLAEEWIENLDEKGFLSATPEDMARQFHLPTTVLEEHLKVLQTFAPPGIFARTLSECFLIQLQQLNLSNSPLYHIIHDSFAELLKGQFGAIKKKHKIDDLQLAEAIHQLSKLSTRPASNFESAPTQPIQPDLRIAKVDSQWIVEPIEESLPKLRLRAEYLDIPNLPLIEKETLRNYTASAKWLIRAIQKRRKLLLALSTYLVQKQARFLNQKGPLTPITPTELAQQFGVHESTISRALSDKYLAGPTGLIPLKSLVPSQSNERAKELLQKLIAQEDKQDPLTDEQLTVEIKKAGCQIARRTVAKYRKQLKIGSISTRKHSA